MIGAIALGPRLGRVFRRDGGGPPLPHNIILGAIGNAALASHLLTRPRGLVIIAAHSSGSFVAHELFAELGAMEARGAALLRRTVYYDLDGGESGLTPEIVAQLRRAYFVYAEDSTTGTLSANAATMMALGARYASAGGALEVNAARSGCAPRPDIVQESGRPGRRR